VAHPLAEGLALIEGSVSVLRYAAWGVDELRPAEAIRAAQIAKVYCARRPGHPQDRGKGPRRHR
jgi:hypothetical protein